LGLLGCHVSISGGVQKAPERGAALGCEAIQIFTRNQRRWASKPLAEEQASAFREELERHHIQAVMAHSIYLINLASPDSSLRSRSEEAFLDEMDRCEMLGIPYLVFHPGSHRDSSKEAGIESVADSLTRLLDARPDHRVVLLLETTAGAGDTLGGRFEELAEIRDRVGAHGRLEVCFDTAHVFQAGYDLRTPEALAETLDLFDSQIGLDHLKAFHLNDSRTELGSHRDLHEHIGRGHIGLEAFRALVNDKRFARHPMALETPGGEEGFRRNLELLYSLRRSKKKR